MKERNPFTVTVVSTIIIAIAIAFFMLLRGNGQRNYRISVIVSNSTESRWNTLRAGLEQAAEDSDIRLNYVYTSYLDTLEDQVRLMEAEINDGSDGIITEFCDSQDTQEIIQRLSVKAPIVMINTTAEADPDVEGNHASVTPDNYEIGRAIGNELIIAYGDELGLKSMGIISGNPRQTAMQERLRGFMDVVSDRNPVITWQIPYGRDTEGQIREADQEHPADILIGLDNGSLEAAVDYVSDQGLQDKTVLFGAGCSEKLVYYIDSGLIRSMILPDDFRVGYQSLTDLAGKLDNRMSVLTDRQVGYNVVHKENLFREENQNILFPIVQ
jgi:ABC-type sugar transport system substrate-binding protein